jgi:S-adenosylmethionine:tRNA-ribosyltransferase-isomerase (queuine synthetase)
VLLSTPALDVDDETESERATVRVVLEAVMRVLLTLASANTASVHIKCGQRDAHAHALYTHTHAPASSSAMLASTGMSGAERLRMRLPPDGGGGV